MIDGLYDLWFFDRGVFLGVVAWVLAAQLVGLVFRQLQRLLDWVLRDDLPQTASAWVEDQLDAAGLANAGVRIVGGPPNLDAFFPGAGIIVLSRRTSRKRDPFFWAIAAHELGHAVVHLRVRILGWLLLTGRLVGRELAWVARLLVLANLMFGSPELNDTARQLLYAALAGGTLVLLDELLATAIAMWLLVSRGNLRFGQVMGAAVGLLLAFVTYVASMAADVLVLVHFDTITAAVSHVAHFTPVAGVGWGWTIALVIATLVMAWMVLAVALGALTTNPAVFFKGANGPGSYAALLFLWVTVDTVDSFAGQLLFGVALLVALPAIWSAVQWVLGRALHAFIRGRPRFWGWTDRARREVEDFAQIILAAFGQSWLFRAMFAARVLAAVPYVVWYWLW